MGNQSKNARIISPHLSQSHQTARALAFKKDVRGKIGQVHEREGAGGRDDILKKRRDGGSMSKGRPSGKSTTASRSEEGL